ncbi:MAG: penicillin-binding transpeptidase domain-containing protein, partial [Pseudomonadota bacterium]
MKYLACLFASVASFSACSENPPIETSEGFDRIVASHGINADAPTLIIRRQSDNSVWIHNPARAEQRFVPASTTKIPHSLIAMEESVASPETIFKWDGQARAFDAWNQDQTLMSAYQRSAVWVYQDIIGTVGTETVKRWLDLFDYGDFSAINDETLTTYWLSGPLQISAREQEAFLQRLVKKDLPLSQQTYAQAWP